MKKRKKSSCTYDQYFSCSQDQYLECYADTLENFILDVCKVLKIECPVNLLLTNEGLQDETIAEYFDPDSGTIVVNSDHCNADYQNLIMFYIAYDLCRICNIIQDKEIDPDIFGIACMDIICSYHEWPEWDYYDIKEKILDSKDAKREYKRIKEEYSIS